MQPFQFIEAYSPLFDPRYTYYIISGGRGGGKSYQIAAYLVMKLLSPEYFRGVIARYTQQSLKKSIYQDILDILEYTGAKPYIDIRGEEIHSKVNRNKIVTHSMKLSENTMSAKGKGLSGITHLLIDEATEVHSEGEYIKLVDSIRTPNSERKIFILFNPEAKSHWIHRRWFIDGRPNPKWFDDHCFIHTTYKDNPFFDAKKAAEWDKMALLEPHRYHYHILGNWKDFVDGRVFEDWVIEDDDEWYPDPEAEVRYGLDFGTNDPSVLLEVRVHKNKVGS